MFCCKICKRFPDGYLPLLSRDLNQVAPKALEQRLADDPNFFCEVIQRTFRSEKQGQTEQEPTEEEKSIAQNAYRLLHDWQTVPGTAPDGSFDGKALGKWLADVKQQATASGHLSIALDRVGKVLAHAPADPQGLWIHKAVAEALNAKDAESMLAGFTCEQFNMRGAHWDTKGKQEREIAADYYAKANALEGEGCVRLATAVRELAKGYEREAESDARRDSLEG